MKRCRIKQSLLTDGRIDGRTNAKRNASIVHPPSTAISCKAKASGWLQSVVTTTDVLYAVSHIFAYWTSWSSVTDLLLFVVECGIARFLCTMRVFDARVSSSSHRLPLCQISFLSHILPTKKNRILKSINQSLSQLIWCPGNRSFRFGIP